MDWRDIAAIVFICTTVNHLGLIKAIEERTGRELPVINCPKCFTFWSVMTYGLVCCCATATPIYAAITRLLAISLLCSYIALWLELFMYAIDTLYNRIYGKIENNSYEEDSPEGG
jgi:CBS domain containing-hemolysin-like protein